MFEPLTIRTRVAASRRRSLRTKRRGRARADDRGRRRRAARRRRRPARGTDRRDARRRSRESAASASISPAISIQRATRAPTRARHASVASASCGTHTRSSAIGAKSGFLRDSSRSTRRSSRATSRAGECGRRRRARAARAGPPSSSERSARRRALWKVSLSTRANRFASTVSSRPAPWAPSRRVGCGRAAREMPAYGASRPASRSVGPQPRNAQPVTPGSGAAAIAARPRRNAGEGGLTGAEAQARSRSA